MNTHSHIGQKNVKALQRTAPLSVWHAQDNWAYLSNFAFKGLYAPIVLAKQQPYFYKLSVLHM